MGRAAGLCRGSRRVDAPGRRRARPDRRDRRRRRQPAARGWATRSPPARAAAIAWPSSFFGDGAVQAGHFNEAVNLAALWRLPLIFVCENNGMAEFTTRARAHPDRAGQRRRRALRVRARGRSTATTSTRSGRRSPSYLAAARGGARAVPARMPDPPPARPLRGRSGGTTATRSADAEWQLRDPLARLEVAAIARGWLDDDHAARDRRRRAAPRSSRAVEFARASPSLDPAAARGARLRADGWDASRPTSRRSTPRSRRRCATTSA